MKISKLKLRKLKRELHEASDVEAFLTDMLLCFKTRLLSVPSKLAMKVAGENDINQVIMIIKEELLSTLEELSEYNPAEIDSQSEGIADEDEEDDEDEEEDGVNE